MSSVGKMIPGPWKARRSTACERANPAYSKEISWIIEGDVDGDGTWAGWEVAWLSDGECLSLANSIDEEVSAFVEANARAIAALPDLVEALRSTLAYAEAYCRTMPDDGPEQDAMMTSTIGPARAALAKLDAEGGAA